MLKIGLIFGQPNFFLYLYIIKFSYDDCKARNVVVCEYLMVELIRKHLKENGREE